MHFCTKCNKSFKFKSRLKTHQITCLSEKEFECGKCGKKFKNRFSYCGHMGACGKAPDYVKLQKMWAASKITGYNNDKEYSCTCGLIFIGKQNYAAHKSHCNKPNRNKNYFTKESQAKAHETFLNKIKNGEIVFYWKGKNLTDEHKEKIRRGRFAYLQKKTGDTPWDKRHRREFSYLEGWFKDEGILKYNLQEKYDIVYEYSEYPYFLDFAFLNIKLAVELDGKCHFKNGKERLQHDINKDLVLIERGWKIYRIRFDQVSDETIKKFLDFLETVEHIEPKVYGDNLYKYSDIKK